MPVVILSLVPIYGRGMYYKIVRWVLQKHLYPGKRIPEGSGKRPNSIFSQARKILLMLLWKYPDFVREAGYEWTKRQKFFIFIYDPLLLFLFLANHIAEYASFFILIIFRGAVYLLLDAFW